MENILAIRENLLAWVREAGAVLLEKVNGPLKIEEKSSDIDLVTEMDLWTESFLLEKIQLTYPTHTCITEETGKNQQVSDYVWIIDPIDGTTNYAHGFPFFAISIALQYKGETVLGVVYAPKLNECFHAIKGEGAYVNEQKLQVSAPKDVKKSLLATGFPYDRATAVDNNVDYFSHMMKRVQGIRRAGSAALDLCYVAKGTLDGYWEMKLKIWDIAAGALIVKEAGGQYQEKELAKGFSVLASAPSIFPDLHAELHSIFE